MTYAFYLRNCASYVAMVAMLCAMTGAQALAGPKGGAVTSGSARISSGGGGVTTIRQRSNRAVIDWQSFDVGTQESVSYLQPGQHAAILNRVTGGAGASQIDGSLTANGQVFVLNPDGVVIGETGRIASRGGFVASTLDIEDSMFMRGGDLRLSGDGSGAVINRGVIESEAGDVVLVAPRIGNFGTLRAKAGTAALGAGTAAWLRPADDQILHIDTGLQIGGRGVDNQGIIKAAQAELKAAGGSVYDLAINQSGTVRATGVERRNGRILLSSGGGSLEVSGTQEARNQDGSGGVIYAGGGFQGSDAAIENAETLTVRDTAVFDVSASAGEADGGRVILWSDGLTSFQGSIKATGGTDSGDGGFAEVSGLKRLDFRPSSVDLSAETGSAGTLLLDPDDLLIVDARMQGEAAVVDTGSGTVTPEPGSGVWDPDFAGSEVLAETVEGLLETTNVVLQASGSIFGRAPVETTAGSTNNLTLTAGQDIILEEMINLQQGDLSLLAQGSIQGPSAFPGFPGIDGNPITANRISIGASGGAGLAFVDLGSVALSAQAVDLDFGTAISGDVNLGNAANTIGEVNLLNAGSGGFSGALTLVNDGDGLTVNGSLAGADLTGLSIVTDGDLSLGADFDLSAPATSGALDLVLASTNGDIKSQAPASAFAGLDAGANQRLLAYSTNKSQTNLATDLSLTEVTQESYASAPPSGLPADGTSRIFYLSGLGQLTLTADDISRAYGSANGALTFSVEGLVGSDTFDAVTTGAPALTVAADTESNIGSYEISIGHGDLELTSATYTGFSFVPGKLSVTPAELIASPVTTTVTYGDNFRIPVTFTGFRNGDTAQSLGLQNAEAAVPGAGGTPDVGRYDAIFAAGTFGNYRFVDNGATEELVVTPRPLTIHLRDRNRIYGETKRFLAPTFEGLVRSSHEEDFTVRQSTAATVASDVGTYAISGAASAAGSSASNYDVSIVPGRLNITPAPLSLAVDATSREYGEDNPIFSATPTAGTYWRNGDDASDVNLSFATDADSTSDVGTYGVRVSGSARNYTIEPRLSGSALTITPAPLTITAENLSKEYGNLLDGSALSFSVEGLKLEDQAGDLGSLQATSDGFAAESDVVSDGYAVNITGLSNPNYRLASANTPTLTVTPAELNLSVGDAFRAYGDSAFEVSGTTATGLRSWDSIHDLGLSYASAITDSSLDAGQSRPITAQLGTDVVNYTLADVIPGTATVTRRKVRGYISRFQRFFGNTSTPNMTVSGLVNGDTLADIDGFSFDGVHDDALTDVGTYTVTGLIEDNNYELASPARGTLTIIPRRITVIVPEQNRTYGDAGPVQIEIGNMAPGHTLEDVLNGGGFFSAGADPHANVGTYEVTGRFHNDNYEVLSQVIGDVNVRPAPLTIDMSDVTVAYAERPNATYTVEGLQNGETLQNLFVQYGPQYLLSEFSLPDGRKEDVVAFSYQPAVLANGEKPMDNYFIRVDRGAMEVTKRQIYIAAHDILRELAADYQREELYPGLVYEGGTLVGGRLVNGNGLGLAYIGDETLSVIPGNNVADVLQVVVTLDGRTEDPDADRKYDITYVGELGDVITKNNQIIELIEIDTEVESTTTSVVMDDFIATNDQGQIVDPEACESLGKVMVDGVCDLSHVEYTLTKAPDVVSPLTAGLMDDLTTEPSDTLVEVFSNYLIGGIQTGALSTDMIYLIDDLRNGRISGDAFMARALAEPGAGSVLMEAMDGYIQALVNADPGSLTEAETLLRGRYEYRARRMANQMYWDLVAAKDQDDARRASEDATLGGLVAKAPAGYVLDGVLGNYTRDLGDQMLAISGGASAAGFAGGAAAVPIAYVAHTAAQAAPLGAIITSNASSKAAVVAANLALNKMSAVFGSTVTASTAGVAGGIFLTAAIIGVQSGIAQSEAANREAELAFFMERLHPDNFSPGNVPPAMHALIMSELATGATLGGN